MRTVWFHREYTRLYGGHLKHAHYFGHVARLPGFAPRITYTGEPATAALARERSQLWPPGEAGAAVRWTPGRDDVLFLAGVDWRYLAAEGLDALPNPRVNLIQHVRHAHEGTELYGYLAHKAVRICVSREVADAIRGTGRVNGPVVAIPNGIDIVPDAEIVAARRRERRPVMIVGDKSPELAQAVATELATANIEHIALTKFCAREDFLKTLAESSVAVCLPRAEEGFYLPALEAMGLGCVVVTLDCIGNRGFCRAEENCLIAQPTAGSLVAAIQRALRLPARERATLLRRAAATANAHSLDTERKRFHAVLTDIDQLWADE